MHCSGISSPRWPSLRRAIAVDGQPPFWLYLATILPILVAHSFAMPNVNSARR